MMVNRQITLAAHPVGFPKPSDFQIVEATVPRPGAGEVLVKALYLSVDPYIRGRISGRNSYVKAHQPGDVIGAGVVGRVLESRDPRYEKDEIVEGLLGWQEYALTSAKTLRKIDPSVAPISTALYVLGMPGMTAYFGLLDICRPQPGETVVISGAGGAVGSLVGQIAKIKRCRVVGIAGRDEKIEYITRELGFEGGLNYNSTSDYEGRLKQLCPSGVDVYFDNVGGPVSDAVMALINTRARVGVCGQISQYNTDHSESGPRWFGQILVKQAKVEGFLSFQWADRYDEALRHLTTWLREGRIKYREQIAEGLENTPAAFIGMLRGENIGKQLVKLAD